MRAWKKSYPITMMSKCQNFLSLLALKNVEKNDRLFFNIIFLSALPSIFIATIRSLAWTVVHLHKIFFHECTNLFLIGSGYEENLCALIVRKRESFYFAFKIKAIADAEYKEIWNKVTCYKVPGMKTTLFVISLLPFRIGNWIYKMIFI